MDKIFPPRPSPAVELESYYDLLPDIVARFDRDFRHLFVNKAIEPVTGRKREEFFGKTNAELGMPTNLVNLWHGTFNKILKNKAREEIDFEFPSKDGIRFYHLIGNPEYDASGEVISIFIITRDLTEKRRLQEKMMQAVRHSSYLSVISEFTHHLNNPLTVVLARLEILERKKESLDASGFLEHLHSFKNELMRMKNLVTDMTKVSSPISLIDVPKYSMRVSEVIDAAIQMCGSMRLNEGVKIQLNYLEDFLLESGFNELLEASLEVIKNALESSRLGSDARVSIETKYTHPVFNVSVFDTGPGILADALDKIFLPFFTTKGPSYRGLGLTIAQSRMQRLGGKIEYSRENNRNHFQISFPLFPGS